MRHTEGSSQRTLELMDSMTLLAGLEPRERATLAAVLKPLDCAPNHELYREGRAAQGLFVVCSGRVVLFKELAGRARHKLTELGPNTCCGLTGLFDGGASTETAIVAEPTTLLVMQDADVRALLQRDSALAWAVLLPLVTGLCRRARAAQELLHGMYAQPQETLMLLHRTGLARG